MIKKYLKFFLFACICFIIADIFVNADEKDNFIVPSSAQFYDNASGTLNAITTDYVNNSGSPFYMSYSIHTIPSSAGAAISFNLNEPLIAGYVYTMSVSVGPIGCGETRLSSLNRIGVGGSFGSAKTYYQNGGNATIQYSDYQVAGQGYKGVSFAFTPNTNGTYIVIPYTTANNCTDVNHFYGYTINNLGSSNNVSKQDINNSINNQTNIINNSITNTENNLKNAINQSTEDISNSIDLSNYNCMQETTKKDFHFGKDKYVENNGTLKPASNYYYTTDFIRVSGTTITFSGINGNNYHLTFFNKDYNIIGSGSILQSTTYNLPSGTYYIKFSLTKDNYNNFTLKSNSCIYVDKNISTDNAINDVNNSLNDDSAPDTPDFSGLDVSDHSVISDLVTMPITIAEHILDSFNDTCSNYTIPFFNNTTLTLPCFTIGDYVGDNIAHIIDLAIILFMIYNIAMLAISAFNDLTSLRDSYDSLYVPQHGPHSYEPRHGKE